MITRKNNIKSIKGEIVKNGVYIGNVSSKLKLVFDSKIVKSNIRLQSLKKTTAIRWDYHNLISLQ